MIINLSSTKNNCPFTKSYNH